jgi:hypothetical protein
MVRTAFVSLTELKRELILERIQISSLRMFRKPLGKRLKIHHATVDQPMAGNDQTIFRSSS